MTNLVITRHEREDGKSSIVITDGRFNAVLIVAHEKGVFVCPIRPDIFPFKDTQIMYVCLAPGGAATHSAPNMRHGAGMEPSSLYNDFDAALEARASRSDFMQAAIMYAKHHI